MADIKTYLDTIASAASGDSVRDAIINCMNEINKDSAYVIKSRNINGKVSQLPSRIDAPAGVLYKTINLNIQNDDGESMDNNIVSHDFTVDMNTESRNYTAEELWGNNAKFGTITVNLDFSQYNNNVIDIVELSTDDLEADGTFKASSRGYSSMSAIRFTNVNPIESKGGYIGEGGVPKFNIEYWDSDSKGNPTQKVYGPVAVTANDFVDDPAAQKALNPPVGLSFSKWKPDKATETGRVIACYSDVGVSDQDISDTWAQIANAGGSGYPYGARKAIDVVRARIPYSAEKSLFPFIPDSILPSSGYYEYSFSCSAVKVAEGEGNSHSSWLTTNVSWDSATDNGIPNHIRNGLRDYWPEGETPLGACQYDEHPYMLWFNNIFLKYAMPDAIRSHIIAVPKRFTYANLETNSYTNHTKSYPLWLPSVRELYIDDWDIDKGSFRQENTGYYEHYVTMASQDMKYMDKLQFYGGDGSVQRKLLFGQNQYETARDSRRVSVNAAESPNGLIAAYSSDDPPGSSILNWTSQLFSPGCCHTFGVFGFCL